MKELSSDIEISIENSLEGMTRHIKIIDIDDNKLSKLVTSRTESFSSIKEMIVLWQNSPNAPSQEKLRRYTKKLIDAGETSIALLREALRKKIDFDDLDAELYGTAIKSKPIIYRAITEINAGLVALKLQLESDKLDFKEREFRRGFPEKFASQEFYPSKDYHKEWYDEKTDSIMICPKSTKGEIITLDGLNIMLPAIPKRKKDILFSNLPKEEQYWRRIEPPKGLTPENEDAYTDFIMEEFRRRREGVHFMNNGEVVYLTPAHYLGLQWNEMLETGGYKEFRMAQAKMYYFAMACLVDPRCVGKLFVKGRRTGFTEMAIDHMVNASTSMKNGTFGITSKTEKDAIKAFTKYSYVIQNLPFFFIPVVQGKIDDIKKMVFGKPSDNTKAAKKLRDTTTKDYLNTMVDYRATATLAYDSVAMDMYLGDEAGKWERPNNYIDHWANVKPTLVQGCRVKGKAFIGSTLNPLNKGGAEYQKMYYGSDVTKRNENGRTTTGLYSFYLPAHLNYEDYTDKYGICHTVVAQGDYFYNAQNIKMYQGSLQFLENEFAAAKKMGGKEYNNARRLDPITIEDAFRDELASQLFDIEKINAQLTFNRQHRIDETLVRGNFEWKDGIPDTTVEWRPMPKGRFLLAYIPPEEYRNKYVQKPTFGVMSKAPAFDWGALASDTYDQTAVVDSQLISTENGTEYNLGSKGSVHGYTGMNIGDFPSNFFFLEYIARPEEADIFFEDVLKACVFYSLPILVENNKKMLLKHFKVRGYRGYCLNRFDKPMNRLSPDEKELGGIPSNSPDIINAHWSGIEAYVKNFVGEYYQGEDPSPIREEGVMGSMPFNRTLQDWLKFNVKNRTAFDASISSGYAILAVNRHKYTPRTEKKSAGFGFATFSN